VVLKKEHDDQIVMLLFHALAQARLSWNVFSLQACQDKMR